MRIAERLLERIDLRDAVEPAPVARQLADDPEAMGRPQQQMEAAVGEALVLGDEAGAADLVRRRVARHLARTLGPDRDHPDPAIARERVLHHLAVARLEDVEGNACPPAAAPRSRAERAGASPTRAQHT